MIQSDNPKARQKQIAKLLEGTSIASGQGALRPSVVDVELADRRDTYVDEGEADRDRDKEREQDAEEKALQRDYANKDIGSNVTPIKNKKQLPKKEQESDLKFSKEPVHIKPSSPSSPLTDALQRRMGSPKRDDKGGIVAVGAGSGELSLRVTVFLPISTSNSKAGQFVQFEVSEQALAKSLINAALKVYSSENRDFEGADPSAYRIYLAEIDGEVDTDIPALQEDCTIASTGAKHFALRKKGRSGGSDAGSPPVGSMLSEDRGDGEVEESIPMTTKSPPEKRKSEKRKSEKRRSEKLNNENPMEEEDAVKAQNGCCIIA